MTVSKKEGRGSRLSDFAPTIYYFLVVVVVELSSVACWKVQTRVHGKKTTTV